MTIPHPTTTSTTHPQAVRTAWIAVAVSPVVLAAVVGVTVLLGGSDATGGWLGGSLIALVALVAPTIALLQARTADREADHGAGVLLAAAAAVWLLVVAVLALAVVSAVAVMVGLTLSACTVLVEWGNPQQS